MPFAERESHAAKSQRSSAPIYVQINTGWKVFTQRAPSTGATQESPALRPFLPFCSVPWENGRIRGLKGRTRKGERNWGWGRREAAWGTGSIIWVCEPLGGEEWGKRWGSKRPPACRQPGGAVCHSDPKNTPDSALVPRLLAFCCVSAEQTG